MGLSSDWGVLSTESRTGRVVRQCPRMVMYEIFDWHRYMADYFWPLRTESVFVLLTTCILQYFRCVLVDIMFCFNSLFNQPS